VGGGGEGGAAGRATVSLTRGAASPRGAASANRSATSEEPRPARVLEAAVLTEAVLAEAGVEHAAALALVHDDDETNIRAALMARRLNPRLRLVVRLYNRRLGQHIEALLDQASALAMAGIADAGPERPPERSERRPMRRRGRRSSPPARTPRRLHHRALRRRHRRARAGGDRGRRDQQGRTDRRADAPGRGTAAPGPGEVADPGLCTLALLSATTNDPAGADGSESSGENGPRLLPDERSVAAATGRGTVVLETVSYSGPPLPAGRSVLPFGRLFSRRLRWSFAGLVACVVALAVASMVTTGDHPLRATYLTLLDLFAINDPALDEPLGRQILQLLSGLVGLLLLPVLLAAVLEGLGTFRSGTALRKPPRGLSDHVVLLGLGKIGTRVLARLRELHIPVVCVEADPEARGLALARRLRVPVVLGDVTQEGVLEAAKIHRAHALLALTSADTTNLEASLYARSVRPDLRVVLRLYDDDFATAVYRTLRATHPHALTRSRSVSHLAAPAFAGAMMGRQILGAIPVERRVLLFAALDVAGHPHLEGRTVAEAFRAGAWRVLALDSASPEERRPDLATAPAPAPGSPERPSGLVWDLPPTYVLGSEDRVVIAATRRGLAELLGRRPRDRTGA
jgi:Trk K+ transport system NAD-binding subunit